MISQIQFHNEIGFQISFRPNKESRL